MIKTAHSYTQYNLETKTAVILSPSVFIAKLAINALGMPHDQMRPKSFNIANNSHCIEKIKYSQAYTNWPKLVSL